MNASSDTPPGSLLQFDFCVPESQRLADLYGMAQDVEQAISFCDLHIEIDPTEAGISSEERLRREHTRQALCKAGLVAYARAFSGAVRPGLDKAFVARLSPNAQSLHSTVKALRDKWVAHAVNDFEDVQVRIDATVTANGTVEVRGVSLASRAIGGFVMAWMMQFRGLCREVLALIESDVSSENARLTAIARELPPATLAGFQRVDGVPMQTPTRLDPTRARSRFKAS
mgnify:CR=1 FL=1|tara:strand:- start:2651 stop:3334 length:684 start_codon:yes stop_codon:yes gene_type:complete